MKKYIFIGVLLAGLFILNGCSGKTLLLDREELEDLELVRAIGVDKSPDNPEGTRLTITSRAETPKAGEGQTGGEGVSAQGSAMVMSSDGKTAFEAARKFQTFNKKQIFWGHTGFYIIGEEAAREDLIKHLDLLSRGQELRLNSTVYVAKEATAEQLLKTSKTSDFFVPDLLENLSKNVGFTSTSGRLEQIELMGKLDDAYADVIVPALHICRKKHTEQGDNGEEAIEVELDGYAVFKDTQLLTFTNTQEALGINFITNKVKSGCINVKDSTGKSVALEIIKADTKIIPHFGSDTVSVLIKTAVDSNITEMHSTIDIFHENELKRLEEQQADVVRQDILDAVKLAQANNVDILGIANRIYHKYPVKWQSIKDSWKEIFPKMRIDVEVVSTLKRTYDIGQPNKYKAGERK